MRTKVTARQQLVLRKIKEWAAENGRLPTVREVAAAAGLRSPATAHGYLCRLADAGLVQRQGRSWRLVESAAGVPLVGMVPAGKST